jgi:threonine dehydratase
MSETPTFQDVLSARKQISPYLPRTPLHRYPALDALLGTPTYVKHENYQPVGAFKVRGGINLVSRFGPEERRRGVIAVSTGNHGQSLAFAARRFGTIARIVVPENADPGKVAAIEGMGAAVFHYGKNFDEARKHCEQLAEDNNYRYVHSANEPLLIAGVGTETLEMLEDEPGLEVIIVPIGGGSGAAGACIAAKAINPRIMVIGVQSAAAPAAYQSWSQRQCVGTPSRTLAEGLATGMGFELTQAIIQELLDDFVLVDDEELLQAMAWMVERAHTLAEAAGSAPLAAAYRLRNQLAGRTVGLICSGGNASPAQLREALARLEP